MFKRTALKPESYLHKLLIKENIHPLDEGEIKEEQKKVVNDYWEKAKEEELAKHPILNFFSNPFFVVTTVVVNVIVVIKISIFTIWLFVPTLLWLIFSPILRQRVCQKVARVHWINSPFLEFKGEYVGEIADKLLVCKWCESPLVSLRVRHHPGSPKRFLVAVDTQDCSESFVVDCWEKPAPSKNKEVPTAS